MNFWLFHVNVENYFQIIVIMPALNQHTCVSMFVFSSHVQTLYSVFIYSLYASSVEIRTDISELLVISEDICVLFMVFMVHIPRRL